MSIEANKRATQLKNVLLKDIAQNNKLSAIELTEKALHGIADYGNALHPRSEDEMKQALIGIAEKVKQARPSVAALEHSLDSWIHGIQDSDCNSVLGLVSHAQQLSKALHDENLKAIASIAEFAVDTLKSCHTIMTHSHCPAVFYTFKKLKDHNVEVITTESRPGMEGLHLAKQLGKMGIHTHYITDAQMGLFAPKADAIVVGADSILDDGSAISKSGSYLLALAAAQARVPYYVCCESFKFSDTSTETARLENRNTAELNVPHSPLLQAHNIFFDVTPHNLITAYITETGLISPLNLKKHQLSQQQQRQKKLG
ncbi:MAG: hypothetical protein K6L73_03580 [Cellvibrionaceae bacterium]